MTEPQDLFHLISIFIHQYPTVASTMIITVIYVGHIYITLQKKCYKNKAKQKYGNGNWAKKVIS
jgi:hypothetical protein